MAFEQRRGGVHGLGTGPFVRAHTEGPVHVIVLDRPERHNALVRDLIDGARHAVGVAATSPDTRAIVLTAAGPNFSTGGDVTEFAARSGTDRTDYARRIVGGLHALILDLITAPVPVIAAVRGAVTGGSLGLVLAADAAVVASDATFRPYYVDVGFSPDGGWTALLPDRVGRSRAMAAQLANDEIDAPTALGWGLATAVTDGDVHRAAVDLAQLYATKMPGAVRRTKRLTWGDVDAIATRLDAELENFVEQIGTDEAASGMAAFLDGRIADRLTRPAADSAAAR